MLHREHRGMRRARWHDHRSSAAAGVSRYRTPLVVKLFPRVPRGLFGSGRAGERITAWLERHVFHRELEVSPRRAAYLAAGVAALALWAVLALALSLHALGRAEAMREEVQQREADLLAERRRLASARRDVHVLLSRLEPLNERVDKLSRFSQRLALAAGVESLAGDLDTKAEDRRLDLALTEDEIAELDRRFAQLGTYIEDREFELVRTPSISPLRAAFVPTDRYGFRSARFLHEPSAMAHGGDGRQFHAGLDMAAPEGTPVHATADGVVHFAGSIPARQDAPASLYGNFVVLDHGNGMRTVYAHCSEVLVETGQEVKRGQPIARVGTTGRSTGPHLHYEVVVHGRPLDPELFMLDLALPDRRERVDVDASSLLITEVDKLLAH
jgi:murein DD-endopeptidase MepM/ murein hydrolase activator NlpD